MRPGPPSPGCCSSPVHRSTRSRTRPSSVCTTASEQLLRDVALEQGPHDGLVPLDAVAERSYPEPSSGVADLDRQRLQLVLHHLRDGHGRLRAELEGLRLNGPARAHAFRYFDPLAVEVT